MKSLPVAVAALLAIAGAQGARALARDQATSIEPEPFAPTPETASMASLGYRELSADLLFFRLVGYFGGKDYTAAGVASLVEAINALDPHHARIYKWGALAIMVAARKEKNAEPLFLRAIALLERGSAIYPDDYQLPELAGEAYIVDLQTKEPAQRRQWDEAGTRLLESAVRKPNAPAGLGTWIATLQTKLGQSERAKENLRNLIVTTDDDRARGELVKKLAELMNTDSAEVAAETQIARKLFLDAWKRDRPYVPPGLYILTGPPRRPGFDLTDLATGGHDLVDLSVQE